MSAIGLSFLTVDIAQNLISWKTTSTDRERDTRTVWLAVITADFPIPGRHLSVNVI